MKKRTKAYILILMLIITSLFGCSNKGKKINTLNTDNTSQKEQTGEGSSDKKMGRYMEKKIDLPELQGSEEILKILQNTDRKFEVYTVDTKETAYYCYTLKDDMTWKKSEPGWLNKNKYKKAALSVLCLGQDGNYYAAYTDYNNEGKCHILKSDDGGNSAKELKIPSLTKPVKEMDNQTFYPRIDRMQVLQNGNLVIYDMWQDNLLQIYSPEGKKLDKISVNTQQNFSVSGNKILAANESGKGILFYNTENKEAEKTMDYAYNSNGVAYALKDDGTLLTGDSGGIHRMAKDGTLWETTVDGSLNSMSMPTHYIEGLYAGDKDPEDYYAVFTDTQGGFATEKSGGFVLLHYEFDKNVASVPSKQITVYSLTENSTVRQAISLFQGQNSDVKFNYVVAMGEDGGNVADYIRALNTELLAGNGADIIILDGLPVNSYIEKGVLTDISDVLKPLAEKGDILSNIAGYYMQDGKTYRMPVRFSIPVIYGKKDALTAVSDLNKIADYINKTKAKPYSNPIIYHELIGDYLALYEEELFQNNQLSEDKFTEFLQNLKTIAENIGSRETLKDKNRGNIPSDLVIDNSTIFQGASDILGIKAGKYNTGMVQLKDVSDTLLLFALLKDKNLDYNSINNTFLPSGMVGLNKASKEPETAKEFIKFLYSEKVQDANLRDGFPVNNTSFKKWMEEDNPNLMISSSDRDGNELIAEWPKKEERDSLYQMAQTLKKPIDINQVLNNLITEQVLPYLKGDIDINQAVSAVKTKVNTYLSE